MNKIIRSLSVDGFQTQVQTVSNSTLLTDEPVSFTDVVKEELSETKTRKKVVFFDVKDWEKEHINNGLQNTYDVSFCAQSLSTENAGEYLDADIISVFINSKLNADVLGVFKNLRLIATRSTGYDHIDMEYCRANGICVANVPAYGSKTVAEHTFALILAITRRIPESVERVKEGKFYPEGLTGTDLDGKTLGIIGTGNIGKNVAKYAKGFDMNVLAYDPKPDITSATSIGYSYVELDELMGASDIVSLHIPLLDSTKHIISRENLAKTKKGVMIINTARGGLIETDALFDGLKSGHIGGAGIDVIEEEAFVQEEAELLHKDSYGSVDFKVALENHAMAHFPNVVMTPHNAFNSLEALQRIVDATIDNMLSFEKGSCKNIIP